MTGDGDQFAPLDAALVSAAILVSKKLGIKTGALVSPDEVLDVEAVSRAIAEHGSPPLRFSVARDLASAGYSVDDLRPLLVSLRPPGTDASESGLEEERAKLVGLGPTVDWPGFPPGREPTRDPS